VKGSIKLAMGGVNQGSRPKKKGGELQCSTKTNEGVRRVGEIFREEGSTRVRGGGLEKDLEGGS